MWFHFGPRSGEGVPRQLCFLTQSAETIEKKRVVIFVSAKKRRGVRKSVKRQRLGVGGSRLDRKKWRICRGKGYFRGGGVEPFDDAQDENSRLTIP